MEAGTSPVRARAVDGAGTSPDRARAVEWRWEPRQTGRGLLMGPGTSPDRARAI